LARFPIVEEDLDDPNPPQTSRAGAWPYNNEGVRSRDPRRIGCAQDGWSADRHADAWVARTISTEMSGQSKSTSFVCLLVS
jgi:hypothetical protein